MELSATESIPTSRLDNLTKQYPLLFTTQEQEPFALFGFECQDGWYNILYAAFDALYTPFKNAQTRMKWCVEQMHKHPDDEKAREQAQQAIDQLDACQQALPVFVQIKAKFGSLRMYYDGGDARTAGVVDMAETLSSCSCEVCGAPATTQPGRWVSTLCPQHVKK